MRKLFSTKFSNKLRSTSTHVKFLMCYQTFGNAYCFKSFDLVSLSHSLLEAGRVTAENNVTFLLYNFKMSAFEHCKQMLLLNNTYDNSFNFSLPFSENQSLCSQVQCSEIPWMSINIVYASIDSKTTSIWL